MRAARLAFREPSTIRESPGKSQLLSRALERSLDLGSGHGAPVQGTLRFCTRTDRCSTSCWRAGVRRRRTW